MKINILDVPSKYANAPSAKQVEAEINPIKNGRPDFRASTQSSQAEAVAAIKELAIRDGWRGLYDPADTTTTTVSGGVITRIKDSLGNLPDMIPSADVPMPPTGRLSIGALSGFGGVMAHAEELSESDHDMSSMMVFYDTNAQSASSSNMFLFFSSISDPMDSVVLQMITSTAATNGSEHQGYTFPLVSASSYAQFGGVNESEKQVTYGVSQKEPMVVSFTSQLGSLRIGNRLTPIDKGPGAIGSSGGEEGRWGRRFATKKVAYGTAAPAQIAGPVLLMNGDMPDDSRERMQRLLQRLSGAPISPPSSSEYLRGTFASSPLATSNAVATSGFLPDRPSQLASVTKVLTCWIAKQYVPDSNLDDLIEHVPSYLNLDPNYSRLPNLNVGDKYTWRDAFHLALNISHNPVANTIAYHAGRLIDPGTTNPYKTFIDKMNSTTRTDWGWQEAVFSTPQGRYDCIATPRHVNELLSRYTGTLLSILGTPEYTYTIHPAGGGESYQGDISNFTRWNTNGANFPELIGGKNGDTPVVAGKGSAYHTLAVRYANPGSDFGQAATLLDNGAPGASLDIALEEIAGITRHGNGAPADWSPGLTGQILRAERVSAQNYAVMSLEASAWEGGDLILEPIDTFTTARTRVIRGDLITASVRIMSSGAISRNMLLEASILGGSFTTADGVVRSAKITTETSTEFRLQISGVVRTGGSLVLKIYPEGGASGAQFFRARDMEAKVERNADLANGEYTMPLRSFSMEEQSQSSDSSDLAASVGSFTAVVSAPQYSSAIRDLGPGYLQGKKVRMTTRFGSIAGKVLGISTNTGKQEVTIQCASEMGVLNAYNIVAQPYSGPLVGLFEYYFSLAGGDAPAIDFSTALAGRSVTAPGWKGDLWSHLKMLCAAESVQIALLPEGGVKIEPNSEPREGWLSVAEEVPDFPLHSLAQKVEVYNYNSRRISNELVYPPGGWSDDVQVLSVDAGGYAEHTLELSASITNFQQPTFQTRVGPEHMSSSVYTIIGDDEIHISRAQWLAGGGSVIFELGEDTRTIVVKMQGAEGLGTIQGTPMRTFSLALSAGTASSRYSTLRIVGTGVAFDREKFEFTTGVSATETGTEIGATIDNPFINTMRAVVDAGTAAASRYAGFDPTISISSPEGLPGGLGASTLGSTVAASQNKYTVRQANYTPQGVRMVADYSTSWADIQDGIKNGTWGNLEDANDDLTYAEVEARGNRYGR